MPSASDWRSASAYAYVDELNAGELAAEFLRRNPTYQRDYRAALNRAPDGRSTALLTRWGLRFPFDPDERADRTPPVWLPHLAPAVVLLAPAPEGFPEARSIAVLPLMFRAVASDGEYLVLQNRAPVVLVGGATTATPAAAVIPLDQSFPARADAALRLWQAISERSAGPSFESLTPPRRRRLALVLRALDAHLVGETYRTIAQGLFGERRVPSGASWKTHDLRDRTIRLVRAGLQLMRGGYLKLLSHHRRRPRR